MLLTVSKAGVSLLMKDRKPFSLHPGCDSLYFDDTGWAYDEWKRRKGWLEETGRDFSLTLSLSLSL
jgi:hypothetical protein